MLHLSEDRKDSKSRWQWLFVFLIPVQLLVTRENVPPSSWNRSFKAQAWLLHEAHECHRNPRLSHEIYAHLTALRVATRVSQEALRWITYGGTTLHFLLIQFTLFTPALQTRPSTFIHGTHQGEQIRPWNSVRRGVCKVACRGCSWEANVA